MSRLDRVGISCTVGGNIVVYRHAAGGPDPVEVKDVTEDAIRTVVELATLRDAPITLEGLENGRRLKFTLTVTQEELPDDHT